MIIAVVQTKGGVGKSIISQIFADFFSKEDNVALIDADKQGTSKRWGALCAENNPDTPIHVFSGASPDMRTRLSKVFDNFENIIIDCPPSLSFDKNKKSVTVTAVGLADTVIVPVTPGVESVWAFNTLSLILEKEQAERPELKIYFALNKVPYGDTLGRDVKETLEDIYPQWPVLPILPERIDFRKKATEGQTALNTSNGKLRYQINHFIEGALR